MFDIEHTYFDPKLHADALEKIRNKKAFICDMDGVIYRGNNLLKGVKEFVDWLKRENKKFLFLTNNSAPTPRELSEKLARLGIEVGEEHFYTSGICTAKFLQTQKAGGSCYAIGEPGLTYALYEHGFIMNDVNPDFVVVGESSSYNYEKIAKAVRLCSGGAKLIGTNLDVNGPDANGVLHPSCGCFANAIELASKKNAFFCGKPSSLMMRYAQRILGCTREETCIIGDRIDTDVLAGVNSEIDSVLVLSGVATKADIEASPFVPTSVLYGVYEIPPDFEDDHQPDIHSAYKPASVYSDNGSEAGH
ncbi:HAD-superfamily hydrolase [Basidiobolus meristosporus CBS 931.73]|uniref:HAD-superfamily hydrolase n=1 Tax=Basidiobolus meristosporus CBS 931.73 TaxID=1314790 RepID=A0A1Y1XT87_9FUNG|nr:HAD-superfamily hydrolase [Basidiobolus meristosporus CBS 931.73]|eukprot:ORX88961.1 HAD-superfamily hydrolase [Basidiobolus meristosporus CBS 931.73]